MTALRERGGEPLERPARRGTVLVIDDDEVLRTVADGVLRDAGYEVIEAPDGERGVEQFRRHRPDLVLLDLRLPGTDGFETCARIRALPGARYTPILIITGVEDLEAVERAFEAGATDFEVKPVNWTVVVRRLETLRSAASSAEAEALRSELEREELRRQLTDLQRAAQRTQLIYGSPEMDDVLAVVRRVAMSDATVLISGESGTGKELIAHTIHELSDRRQMPFVMVDCGAISTDLIDSELFGHERGAFTGALTRQQGRLAAAAGGTILLDEIGELPIAVQSKLLRFVQDRQVTPVGNGRSRQVDVRVLAATNRDLELEVRRGRFRGDLFYRLDVVHVDVPPLRERPRDILLLARHFLRVCALQYDRVDLALDRQCERLLVEYPWPGNVRELQNRMLQAVLLADGPTLSADDLALDPSAARRETDAWGGTPAPADETRGSSVAARPAGDGPWRAVELAIDACLDELESENGAPFPLGRWVENELALAAVRRHDGVVRRAASWLGVADTSFRRRLAKARAEDRRERAARLSSWPMMLEGIGRVIDDADAANGAPARAESLLLERIDRRYGYDLRRGPRLLGVSAPTFRQRYREHVRERRGAPEAAVGGGFAG